MVWRVRPAIGEASEAEKRSAVVVAEAARVSACIASHQRAEVPERSSPEGHSMASSVHAVPPGLHAWRASDRHGVSAARGDAHVSMSCVLACTRAPHLHATK